MQDVQRSISFRELSWDEIDIYAKSHGFKDRSPFIEHCVKNEVYPKHKKNVKIVDIAILLLLAIITLMISIILIGG
jgi:metal-responsive CopG/Arc/MetJ family transcriptional regulator